MFKHVLASAILAGAPLTVAVVSQPAHAAWQQPYGGCKEATLAPHSKAAAACRNHGWTINRRLAVSPRGVVKGSGLPHCKNEDGSGQKSACSWNFRDGHRDGNGKGLSYWVSHFGKIRYVWAHSPLTEHRHWVGQPLADALAEGDQPHRKWEQCVTNGVHHRVIKVDCPDGYHQEA